MNYIESDNNVIIKDTQSEKEKEFLMPIIERKICKICNRDFSNNNCLGNHIVRTHKISTKNYYDEFLKKIGEGECVVCKKILTFRNLVSGYPTCCHGSCAQRYKLFPENLEKTKRSLEKGKQTCLKRYGVENPFQSEIFKNKSKTTMMKKYGVEHPHHSIEIKKKVKNTCLDRYGVENPFENKNIKDKIKKSLIKRYGVEYISQSKEFKEKTRKTCLMKYGVTHQFKSPTIREKIKKTCIKKYGSDCPLKNKSVNKKSVQTKLKRYGDKNFNNREQYKNTCLKKFGVENPFQSDDIKNKSKETCIKKYGVKYCQQNDDIKEKTNSTMMKKYGVEHYCLLNPNVISNGQKDIYQSIKIKYKDAIFNYFLKDCKKFADIYIPSKKLIVEYNGDYFHMNPLKYKEDDINEKIKKSAKQIWNLEAKRTKLLQDNGYIVKIVWESDWKKNREKIIKVL